MGNIELLYAIPVWFWLVLAVLFIWDIVWKLIALWRSARNNHLAWFVCIVIFNTLGILPIIYLLTHKEEKGR